MEGKKLTALLAGLGAVVGFLNGFFGGGGGMVIVPPLIYLVKVPTKKAHATALLIILPISIVSAIFYFAFGHLDVSLTLKCGIGAVAGGIAGALLLSEMSNDIIKVIFSAVMLAAGIKMLF
jgi:uncharacterized membrane protein YfcA